MNFKDETKWDAAFASTQSHLAEVMAEYKAGQNEVLNPETLKSRTTAKFCKTFIFILLDKNVRN